MYVTVFMLNRLLLVSRSVSSKLKVLQFTVAGVAFCCDPPCSQLLQNANLIRSVVTSILVANVADRLYLDYFTSQNPGWITCI